MKIFSHASESDVTKAIVGKFAQDLIEYTVCDIIIIGGGPSGLMAAMDLSRKGLKVLVVERNNYLGGGFWIGGYLMNVITVRAPGHLILDELNISYEEYSKDLFVTPGPLACSKLIAAACDAGAMVLNMTRFEDIVIREENRVGGAVVNWSPIAALPREITCVDPIALESKFVIDATGHDAEVIKKLEDRDLIKTVGFGAMWVDRSEDLVVEHTGEVYPGVIAVGMSVSTVFGLPRMGPTFGSMLLSGRKGAEIAQELLGVE